MIGRMLSGAPIPAPHEMVPGTPRSLSAVVMRLLVADAAQRTPSAEALYEELTAAEAARGISALTVARPASG